MVVLVNNGSTDATGERLAEWWSAPTRSHTLRPPHTKAMVEAYWQASEFGGKGGRLDWLDVGRQSNRSTNIDPLCGALWTGQTSPRPIALTVKTLAAVGGHTAYHHLMKWKGYSMADTNGCPKTATRAPYEHIQPTAHIVLDLEVMIATDTWRSRPHRRDGDAAETGGESKIKATTLIDSPDMCGL